MYIIIYIYTVQKHNFEEKGHLAQCSSMWPTFCPSFNSKNVMWYNWNNFKKK